MTVIQGIILGIVQGLTEFLPISSSGHLNVFPWLFNWEMLSDGMDVALHIGTLPAFALIDTSISPQELSNLVFNSHFSSASMYVKFKVCNILFVYAQVFL